jgi:hypothetical protein
MMGGDRRGVLQVDAACDRRSSGILNRRAQDASALLTRGSLWIVPDLWKTPRTRFPQGRWTHRTRPHAPQAYSFTVTNRTKAVR